MDEAANCDHLALMREGELLAVASPGEILARTGAADMTEAFLRLIGRGEGRGERSLSPRITLAVAVRVLEQLRRDPRTIGLVLAVPCVLMLIVKGAFEHQAGTFERVGPPMLGLFPLIIMFLITSITMLRERTTGTLERLMTMPMAKLDLLAGYGIAFALVAAVQAAVTCAFAYLVLGLDTEGSAFWVGVLAVSNALLGTSLGLFLSAFARTEFQAVQFMPAFILPQILLCGLLVPREEMAQILDVIAGALPLTYAYDALAGWPRAGVRGATRPRRGGRRRSSAGAGCLGRLGPDPGSFHRAIRFLPWAQKTNPRVISRSGLRRSLGPGSRSRRPFGRGTDGGGRIRTSEGCASAFTGHPV